MKAMKGIFGALLAGSVLFCCPLAYANPPGFIPFEPDEEMRELMEQATALALIHDLALTPEQRKEIQQILQPVQEEKQSLQEGERAFRDQRIKPRLRQVIADLKAGRDPAASPSAEAVDEMEVLRPRMAGLFLRLDQAYEAVTACLTPAQRERLRTFRFEEYIGPMPAMHPAKLLGMEPVELLEAIRNASPEEIDAMVQRMERKRERRAGPGDGKSRPRRARVERKMASFVELVRQIHDMPQADFDARKEQLEKELAALTAPPPPPPGGPPGPGGPAGGRNGPPPPPNPSGGMAKGMNVKRILFSQAFYDSL